MNRASKYRKINEHVLLERTESQRVELYKVHQRRSEIKITSSSLTGRKANYRRKKTPTQTVE